jgi:D-alanyl-D-alanine carboxypeptidase/D-alanyl-D-alanine-endopeptidase (penicillin-binding protein 4)
MIRFRSLLIASLLLIADPARGEMDAALAQSLDKLLGADSSHETVYVARVVDAETSRELYAHDADRAVAPASNMKLANVAAALDRFGPEYLWRTYLAIDGDDLWIIGTGDPSLGDKRIEEAHQQPRFAVLDEFAKALASRGISQIKGRLIIDDGVFDDERIGATWPKPELTESWSAPVTGLSLNQNCISVMAYPDHLDVQPVTEGVKVINHARSAGAAEELKLTREPNANTFTLTGLVEKPTKVDEKAVVDPGLFLADALRTYLKQKGISIAGRTERATRGDANAKWRALKTIAISRDHHDSRVIAVHETSLRDVVNRIDKQSQNLFAEALCKLQGRAWEIDHGRDEPGSWRAGGEAIHAFLRRMEIDDSRYVVVDGSGLSPDNRVTARLISDLFLKMLHHPQATAFRHSLSVCGKDGTLDDRLMDIAGRVQGKTGTIDGVKALSGYVTTDQNHTLVFSMIFNGIPAGKEHDHQLLLDSAARLLSRWQSK